MTIGDAEAQRQMLLDSLMNWRESIAEEEPSTEEPGQVSWRRTSYHDEHSKTKKHTYAVLFALTTDSEEVANKAKEWLGSIESQLESN